jgi:hypothetical protein
VWTSGCPSRHLLSHRDAGVNEIARNLLIRGMQATKALALGHARHQRLLSQLSHARHQIPVSQPKCLCRSSFKTPKTCVTAQSTCVGLCKTPRACVAAQLMSVVWKFGFETYFPLCVNSSLCARHPSQSLAFAMILLFWAPKPCLCRELSVGTCVILFNFGVEIEYLGTGKGIHSPPACCSRSPL